MVNKHTGCKNGFMKTFASQKRRIFYYIGKGLWIFLLISIGVYLYGFSIQCVEFCYLLFILSKIVIIDRKLQIIPDTLIISLLLLTAVSMVAKPELNVINRLIGLFSVSFPMFLLTLTIEDSFGGGDIKLMAVSGLLMGWKRNLLAMFLAIVAGGIVSLYLLVRKKIDKKARIAFGPFLAFGIILSWVLGEKILKWYFKFYY